MDPKGAVGGGAEAEKHGIQAGDKGEGAIDPQRGNVARNQHDEIDEAAADVQHPVRKGEHRRHQQQRR